MTSDDVVGIVPDDEELDAGDAGFGPSSDDLLDDDELEDVDLEALVEGDLLEEDDEEEDPLLGGAVKKKPRPTNEFGEPEDEAILDEDDDGDEEEIDLYGDEDDEARYNFRAEEDPLEDGF